MRSLQDPPATTCAICEFCSPGELAKNLCLPFFQNEHTIAQAGGSGGNSKALQRLFHRLVGEAEGPVMHGNHGLRLQVEESLQRIFRAGVNVAIVRRMVCADWQ